MATFAPEVIIQLGRFPITNTVLNTLLVDAVLIGTALYTHKHLRLIPKTFQNIMEMIIETFWTFIEQIAGKNTPKIFPYVVSFFLFIVIANWTGLIPGFSSFGFFTYENGHRQLIPILRSATSDLNVTLALTFISVLATHMLSLQRLGFREYISRYLSLNPVNLYVGLLEFIGELTKIVSLSFRLFGNIFAGEVVLMTVSSIFSFLFPIPFMMLEVIVGFVQALVFSLLTMVFMSILMTPHHAEEHATKEVINV